MTGVVEVLVKPRWILRFGECQESETGPVAVETGDFFSGDDHLDLVTLNRTSKQLRQYQGNGGATFALQPNTLNLATSGDYVAMSIAPIVGGHMLVIADSASNGTTSPSLQTTTSIGGGFPLPSSYLLGTFIPRLVARGNFDGLASAPGDDVAVVGLVGTDVRLRVYYDLPSPTVWVEYELPDEHVPQGLAAGDLDSDGYADVAVTVDTDSPAANDELWVFRRQAPGRVFLPAAKTPLGTGNTVLARGISITNIDTDAANEVAVADEVGKLKVLETTATPGVFSILQDLLLSPGAFAVVAGRFSPANPLFPTDLAVLHRDQTQHPGTSLLTLVLHARTTVFFGQSGVFGSFDGPAIAVGDFTTLPGLVTPADGIAITNFGRNNLCVLQLQ